MNKVLASVLTIYVFALGSGIAGSQAAPVVHKSVNDGVYSAAQAERGQKVFDAKCTACHDTGRFTGSDFIKSWAGQPIHALFDLVKNTMPEDNPGSLTPQQYADVLSYLLKLNKFPSGESELTSADDALKTIRIEMLKK